VRRDTGRQYAGLAKKSHGEETKRNRPTGKMTPAPGWFSLWHEPRPCVASPAQRGTATEDRRYAPVRQSTATGGEQYRSARLRWVNLNYPTAGRDSAESGLGPARHRRLNDFAESVVMNVRGSPETDVPSSQEEKPGERRSGHSSRRSGKPATGRRAAVCREFPS
jgi:hypothetical protein